MLSYTTPNDYTQTMLTLYRSALPSDMASSQRQSDDAYVFAEIMMWTQGQVDGWTRESRIGKSVGIWLTQHAKDRGVNRQKGENDFQLRSRVANPPDAVTVPALKAALDAMSVAAGSSLPSYVVELTPDSADSCFAGYGANTAALSFCNRNNRVGRELGRTIVVFIVPLAISAAALDEIRLKLPPGRRYIVETY
jgi:hypothetical protein